MFYEKNVIRITYANKSLHFFQKINLSGEAHEKIAVRLWDKLFSRLAVKKGVGSG